MDGILPPGRRQLGAPTYYRGLKDRPEGFTPTQQQRRSLEAADTAPKPKQSKKEETELVTADRPRLQDQFRPMTQTPRHAEKETKGKKKRRSPGRIRSWWKSRSLRFKAAFITALLLIGVGGALGIRLYTFLNSVFANKVGNSNSVALSDKITPDKVNTEGDGRLNVLILGRGGEENAAPNLTDTIIIGSIDLETQSAALLSVPRDMLYKQAKINSTFSTAYDKARYQGKNTEEADKEGIRAATEAARTVAGVPIHKYVLLDFKAFRDVVNALGGVDINVPEPINDYYTNYYFKAGQQTMNGDRALQYARTRHGSSRGDFDRGERQRQLLIAMRNKASSTGIVANPVRLNSLANAIQKNVKTDLSVDEAKTLFTKTKTMADDKIVSLDLAKPEDPLVTTGNYAGQSIVRPVAGLNDFTKIRAYARTNMIDPFLKREAPTVTVYNGSGRAGLATLVGDVMAGYGYKVLIKETSATRQPKTVVVKQTQQDKPFTYRYLTKRFNTIPISNLPSGAAPEQQPTTTTPTQQADFVIVLGADYVQNNDPTW